MSQALMDFETSYQVGGRAFSRDPIARPSDPETSQEAATEIQPKLSKLQRLVANLVIEHGPLTATEAGAMTAKTNGCNAESARKRCRECVRLDLLVEGPPKICSVTGKRAATYRGLVKT